ncbi:MAG: DUF4097 domain-containing protein [FCB group bacterium]|nr:DUF4097 domain-containing protein [FCB group bacterium]
MHNRKLLSFIMRGITLIVLMITVGYAQKQIGEFTKTFQVNEHTKLLVETWSGDITINSDNTNKITVNGVIRAKTINNWFNKELETVAAKIVKNPPVTYDNSSVNIEKIDRDLKRELYVDYKISVPRKISVYIGTGSGDIVNNGLNGPIEIATGSGDVELFNITGTVKITTGSGDVSGLGIAGKFEAKTGSGDIDCKRVTGPLEISTASGDVEIRMNDNNPVTISTVSGEIDISGARSALKATSASGDIDIFGAPNSDWKINAASGDIDVKISTDIGFNLEAKTGSGDIDISLPVTVTGKIKDNQLTGGVRGGGKTVTISSASGDITIR